MTAPRYEFRLNGCRFSRADPAATLAGATLVVAIADARTGSPGARAWLAGTGREWASLLGGAEVLADVLAELE